MSCVLCVPERRERGHGSVITPVLDISQVKKDAKGLPALTNVTPITAATSYGQAATSLGHTTGAGGDGQAAAGRTTFNFEQNNYSPEALSDVEIYRKTKNQLGQLKSVLGVPA